MLVQLLDAVFGTDATDPKREFAETQFMQLLESTTEDLAKALLAAGGSTTRLAVPPPRPGGRAGDRPSPERGRPDRLGRILAAGRRRFSSTAGGILTE